MRIRRGDGDGDCPNGECPNGRDGRDGQTAMTVARAVLAAGVAVALALPFVQIGAVSRSAYATIRSARVLGFTDGPFRTACAALVVLVPALASALLLMHAGPRTRWWRRATCVVGIVIGLTGAAVGLIGLRVSKLTLAGPPTTIGASFLLLFTSIRGITQRPTAEGQSEGARLQ